MADRRIVTRTIADRLHTRTARVIVDRNNHVDRVTAMQAASTVAQLRTEVVKMRRELHRLRLVALDLARLHRLTTDPHDTLTDDPGEDDLAGA